MAKSALRGFIRFLRQKIGRAMIGFAPFLRMSRWKPRKGKKADGAGF